MTVRSRIRSALPFLSESPTIQRSNGVYRAEWSDYTWFIPYDDTSQANWCRNFTQSHERFLDQVTESSVILEVGAATGEYTVEAAKRLSEGHIYTFEAEPRNYRCLEANLKTHGCWDEATPVNMALSDGSKSELEFQVADSIAEHKVTDRDVDNSDDEYRGVVGDAADNKETEISVPTSTLDDYCAENGIDYLDILKLTVNGHEATILSGGTEMLERTKRVFLNVEYDDAKELLANFGFEREFDRQHDALGNPQLWVNKSI